ncbi:conserved Plasmodium protein, unknown function, partial [Plasmodium malariae]
NNNNINNNINNSNSNSNNINSNSNNNNNINNNINNSNSNSNNINSNSNDINCNSNILISNKNNNIHLESDYSNNLLMTPPINARFKNDVIFIDDNVTESAVSVLSENETEELRSFQNVSFFNSKGYAHINNIVNNSYMQYMRKIPDSPNGIIPFFNYNGNNNMMANNSMTSNNMPASNNLYNYSNTKYEDSKNTKNAFAHINDKYNHLEKKRKKYVLQTNNNNIDGVRKSSQNDVNTNIKWDNSSNNNTEIKIDGRKKRRYRKNKNSNTSNNTNKVGGDSNLSTFNNVHNNEQAAFAHSNNNIASTDKRHHFDDSANNTNVFNGLIKKDKIEIEKLENTEGEHVKMDANLIKEVKSNIKKDEEIKEEQIFCPVCKCFYEELSDGSPADGLNWIGCDKCEKWYHWICCKYSIDNPPDMDNDWYCSTCLNS